MLEHNWGMNLLYSFCIALFSLAIACTELHQIIIVVRYVMGYIFFFFLQLFHPYVVGGLGEHPLGYLW